MWHLSALSIHLFINVIKEGGACRKSTVLSYLHVLVEQHDKDEAEDACC